MIFTGDIALPNPSAINFTNIPKDMRLKNWIGNLEGAVVKDDNPDISAVYNHYEAIDRLISDIRFIGFTLANNHIFDSGSYEKTNNFLSKRNIKYTGIGLNVQDACKEIVFYKENAQIIIIGFGWEVIQCEIAAEDKMGVNPLERNHVLDIIKKLKLQYPEGKIVCYMHWSYELEGEPQPFERELARKIIDLGAAGVIGAHPHRVGGFELYKGKPIVYSLGNWMFRQNHFIHGKLKFSDSGFRMGFQVRTPDISIL